METSCSTQDDSSLPSEFSYLNPKDKLLFIQMKLMLQTRLNKNHRNHRIEQFQEVLNIIKTFCVRNDQYDWQRFLACGICWIGNSSIGISIRRFSHLLNRCKSSVNGSFQKIGYKSLQGHLDGYEILNKIPVLKNHPQELREWTLRVRVEHKAVPILPTILSRHQIQTPKKPLPIPIISTPAPAENEQATSSFTRDLNIFDEESLIPSFDESYSRSSFIFNDVNNDDLHSFDLFDSLVQDL